MIVKYIKENYDRYCWQIHAGDFCSFDWNKTMLSIMFSGNRFLSLFFRNLVKMNLFKIFVKMNLRISHQTKRLLNICILGVGELGVEGYDPMFWRLKGASTFDKTTSNVFYQESFLLPPEQETCLTLSAELL